MFLGREKGLLIAEKYSLMKEIQTGYNKIKNSLPYELDFLCQSGHLMQLAAPNGYNEKLGETWAWDLLPIFPEDMGGWKYEVIPATKDKAYAIRDAIRSKKYSFIVHAGDPDREGEYLVRLVLAWAKNTLPVKRFWTNDITEKSVVAALRALKNDNEPFYENIAKAAYCRAHFDWLCGMNLTRAATLALHTTARIGRVKTPTLKIVVDREKEIANFKPVTVYEIETVYRQGFSGILFDENGNVSFQTKTEAEHFIASQLTPQAVVKIVKIKKETMYAPQLYTLSSLQVDAGKKHGYDPDRVLDIVQSLYNKQFLSYPRTACPYLSSNMAAEFPARLQAAAAAPGINAFVQKLTPANISGIVSNKKYINDKALEKEGHSAIVPTDQKPDFNTLTRDEQNIYQMVASRFVAIFLPPQITECTKVVTDNNGNLFRSTGRVVLQKGFTELLPVKNTDEKLPVLQEGATIDVKETHPKEKTSTCPKRYTAGDLIDIMSNPVKFLQDSKNKDIIKEVKGIGTEATRASIIRELIKNGYIREEKRRSKAPLLYAEPSGVAMIDNLSGKNFVAVDLTAEWERKLKAVEHGEMANVALEKEIRAFIEREVTALRGAHFPTVNYPTQNNVPVGVCPKCGAHVVQTPKAYSCEQSREQKCDFVIWKNLCGKTLSEKSIQELLEKGCTQSPVKGFVSKTGKKFDAYLVLDENKKVAFSFERPRDAAESPLPCPMCGKPLIEKTNLYACSDGGCGFVLWKKVAGKTLGQKQVEQLLKNGQTGVIKGFTSKAGKKFDAKLQFKNGKTSFVFD